MSDPNIDIKSQAQLQINWPTATIVIAAFALAGVCIWRAPDVALQVLAMLGLHVAQSVTPPLLARFRKDGSS